MDKTKETISRENTYKAFLLYGLVGGCCLINIINYMETAKFNRELELLGDIEDFNASMEGIVMRYTREDGTPMLYKMTGPFAPANQLLGAAGFETKERLLNRSLKNNSQKKVNESRLKSLTKSVIRKHILS